MLLKNDKPPQCPYIAEDTENIVRKKAMQLALAVN